MAGIVLLVVKLKVAVGPPLKLALAITTPLSTSNMEVIPVVEVVISLKAKLLKVTIVLPGLVN